MTRKGHCRKVVATVVSQISEVGCALADVGQDLKVGRVALGIDVKDNCIKALVLRIKNFHLDINFFTSLMQCSFYYRQGVYINGFRLLERKNY